MTVTMQTLDSVFMEMIPEVFALHDADAGAGRDKVPRLSCCKPESVSTTTFQSQIKFWRQPFILFVRGTAFHRLRQILLPVSFQRDRVMYA